MERKRIQAVILDGFHQGHVVRMDYMPRVRLLKPSITRIDYCCGGDEIGTDRADEIEYMECYRAVDRDIVLYSLSGKSRDIFNLFPWEHGGKPWTLNTTLKMGYHNEPIIRNDDGTQMTEYEKGYQRGVEDGRMLQAKLATH